MSDLYEECAICRGAGTMSDQGGKRDCPACDTKRVSPVGLTMAQVERAVDAEKLLQQMTPFLRGLLEAAQDKAQARNDWIRASDVKAEIESGNLAAD